MERKGQTSERISLFVLIAAVTLPTIGVILILYATCCRLSASDFLARGEIHEATVSSITSRKLRYGGWEVTVTFWDRPDGTPPPGKLIMTSVTDLLPLSGIGKKVGDELKIRWIRGSDPPQVAPEASLHDTTRPWEQRFSVGSGFLAAGAIAVSLARRRKKEAIARDLTG